MAVYEWKDGVSSGVTHNGMHDDFEILDPFENRRVQKNWLFYTLDVVCPIAIFGGAFTNILAFVVLVRGRLWLKHEGYVYLAANFCVNVGILLFCTSSFWMTSVYYHLYPPNTSAFMCKVWHFLMSIFFASGWLSVALLFNVYLREHLIRRRRCGCPMFAAKYCTLFATKIIVGVIFGLFAVLGIPYLAIYELHSVEGVGLCFPSRPKSEQNALLAETILMYAVPFLFYVPILFSMLCKNGQGIVVGSSEAEQKSLADDQMRTVAVTLSSATLLSHFARVLLYFETGYMLMASIHIQIELLFGASLAFQPIFCFVILKALRDGFCSQMRNICCCCRRQSPSLDRGEEVVQYIAIQEDPPNPTAS